MKIIQSPNELGGGWYRCCLVKDEAEALQILQQKKGYLYQSKIIFALYLFIPVDVEDNVHSA